MDFYETSIVLIMTQDQLSKFYEEFDTPELKVTSPEELREALRKTFQTGVCAQELHAYSVEVNKIEPTEKIDEEELRSL